MNNTSWYISSDGENISLRIKSFLALLIPVANILLEKVGVNMVAESIDPFIDAIFIVVFGVLHIWGWARRTFNKKNKLGRFAE